MKWYTWKFWRFAWGPRQAWPIYVLDADGPWRPIAGGLYWLCAHTLEVQHGE